MKRFVCPACGNEIHFENSVCLACDTTLAYAPDRLDIVRSDSVALCVNRETIGCNWATTPDAPRCESCGDTTVIPNLDQNRNLARWALIEVQKRRLYHALDRLGLPRSGNGLRLSFELKADEVTPGGMVTPVVTGHNSGLITLNIAEADDDQRETNRVALGEPYRTLLGHLRHEVGHFYYDILVRGQQDIAFENLFGSAAADYTGALLRHYNAPRADWTGQFISNYATAHPLEDFAETWAHYLHMLDALDSASRYGLTPLIEPYANAGLDEMVDAWIVLSIAMNEMNRALGQRDFYPFVLAAPVREKLRFVHGLTGPYRSA